MSLGTLRAGSLCVVGTGIRAVSQVTQEALVRIQRAGKLHYSSADSVTSAWLHELNPHAESLADLYEQGALRRDIYSRMVDRVLASVRAGFETCLALYGHPGVCARAGHECVAAVRAAGGNAVMLPGVSCEDCLLADLGIDPASAGLQSYEASVFLERAPRLDARAGLLLWQIGMLGDKFYRTAYSPVGLDRLAQLLSDLFGGQHMAVLYEMPVYGGLDPVVQHVQLAQLTSASLTWATTLYVPPRP